MESEDVWRPLDLYQPNTIIFSSPSLHLYAVRRGYSDLLVMLYLLRIYWPAHVYIFIKYILKPQPLSTGKYLLTVKPGENFKVCKLVVTHIGQNFPCAQIRYHPFIT